MGKFGSFLLGGAIGAGIALLFAPRTGEETRALVAEKADEYWGKGQSLYGQGKTRFQDSVAGVQPAVSKTGDELREKIDNARVLIAEQVAKNAAAARDAINEKVPAAAEKINQAADLVRGHIDAAATKLKDRATAIAEEDGVTVSAGNAPEKIEPGETTATDG
ncbi:MAG: YtxH domain-containing protein [Coriobacteriales bacterium]|jgi:gas vesicle protein|nr:YtxH domain-containing protein [Coriobacteriales bacterium]